MNSFRIEPMLKAFLRLKDYFSFDTRALALGRMGLGLSVFVDILWRMQSIDWHYTDQGTMPRDVFLSQFAFPWTNSFHLMNGTFGFAFILLALHGLIALMVAVGYKTRLFTLLLSVFTISLHNRLWYLNNGGDDALRALLFFAVFLPWGEMWSVDWWRKGQNIAPRRVSGSWVAVWFLQAFCVYFVSYILKTSPIWRQDYTAIYYSSHLDLFATPLMKNLRQYPLFLKISTFLTIMLEWLGPLALVLGFVAPRRFWKWVKLGVVASFWGLHLGIILTMSIGLFPFYCIFMWFFFLPTEVLDWFEDRCPKVVKLLNAPLSGLSLKLGLIPVSSRKSKGLFYFSQVFGVFIFATIFFWNLSTLKPPMKVSIPFWINVTRWLHLYQEWNMFSPFPKQENVWLEIPAELENGSSVELLSGSSDILSSKKDIFPQMIPDEHWRKFYMNVADNDKLAKQYAGAWCRLWNRSEDSGGIRPRLRRFSIIAYHHVILPDYKQSDLHKRVVWNHWCFEADLPK